VRLEESFVVLAGEARGGSGAQRDARGGSAAAGTQRVAAAASAPPLGRTPFGDSDDASPSRMPPVRSTRVCGSGCTHRSSRGTCATARA
jgi:hypothetical protein